MNKINSLIVTVIITLSLFLCGCTEFNKTLESNNLNNFIGTWSGNMNNSIVGFRLNHNLTNITDNFGNSTNKNFSKFQENISYGNITMLEFTSNSVYITIKNNNETNIISSTYKLDENIIILQPQINDIKPGGRSSPNEGDFPYDQQPPPGEELPSDWPPYNENELPSEWDPNNIQRFPREIFYNYSFSNDNNILYLDGNQFYKIF